jgi:hypothetical protein
MVLYILSFNISEMRNAWLSKDFIVAHVTTNVRNFHGHEHMRQHGVETSLGRV